MLQSSAPVNYKTVKLGVGKHNDPSEGVCVMELASMIAGERFTDHPRSVCPVIAAFLRTYNDAVDDPRRQDLYRLAALAVGTRGSWVIERKRAQLCRQWSEQVFSRRAWPLRLLSRRTLGLDRNVKPQAVARAAVTAIGRHTDQTHAMALALVEEMCAVTCPPAQPAMTDAPRRQGHLSRA
jgi:hypothetical protein